MSAAPAAPDGLEILVPVEIHLEVIHSRLAPLGRIEHVHLADAAGRTLAASVDALVDPPPLDNSAMDVCDSGTIREVPKRGSVRDSGS
jgi:molybdopterin molybdotransferase